MLQIQIQVNWFFYSKSIFKFHSLLKNLCFYFLLTSSIFNGQLYVNNQNCENCSNILQKKNVSLCSWDDFIRYFLPKALNPSRDVSREKPETGFYFNQKSKYETCVEIYSRNRFLAFLFSTRLELIVRRLFREKTVLSRLFSSFVGMDELKIETREICR